VRVTGAVLVLVTDRRVVVVLVVTVVGAGVAVAAAAGWSGALDACRLSLAKIVMPPKLLSVMAAASARSASVEATRGWRRGRVGMRIGEHPRSARA
jgi:hypothetical protein